MKKTKTEVEFEEILKQVTPFIINLSKGAVGCVEFEDMQQILMIHTWETWQSYDASKGRSSLPICTRPSAAAVPWK